MLRIEIDMFSGRPNPTWLVTEDEDVKRVLGLAGEARGAIAKPGEGYTGLGFREVRVATIMDDTAVVRGLATPFALGSAGAGDTKVSGEIARKLIESMPIRSEVRLLEHALTPLDAKLRDVALEWMDLTARMPGPPESPPSPPPAPPQPGSNPLISTIHDPKCDKCEYEVSKFNPAFWNTSATQPHNNCYNYARNWRTNTFAQPGRAHGAMTSTMACNTVTTAAMADGLKHRCECLPATQFPRRLMALVIAPGWDYHWYRHQREGFWGHKPGGTAARNFDSNGVIITNPETCARGPYTNFCSYFYAGKSVVIN